MTVCITLLKAAISPYVEVIFEVMFQMSSKIPLPVKHLFDIFDELAQQYFSGDLARQKADKWKRNWWVSYMNLGESNLIDCLIDVLVI